MHPSYTDMAGNIMGGRSQPGQGPTGSSLSSGSEGKSEHWKHLTEGSLSEVRELARVNIIQNTFDIMLCYYLK